MTVAKLPEELWVNIIGWVPDDIVRQLLGVNRLFSRRALRAKYRSITVNSHATRRACDRLQHIWDSGYAQYVRCLDIDLTFLSREEPYVLPWMAPKTLGPVHASVAVTRDIRALLLNIVENAEDLTDCCFRWQSGLEFHHQADFLQALWPLLRDSMRNLSLLMTPVYFDTLVQNARNLRALQHLRLDFRFPPSSWVLAEGGIDNFPQFMDSVKDHIRSLDLSWSKYPYSATRLRATPALPHFEYLEELALQVTEPSSLEVPQVARFVERHSDQIIMLEYEVRTIKHLTNLFSHTSFVALTELSLRTMDFVPQMINFLKTTFFPLDRLEKLAVSGYFMTADEVLIVSAAFTLNPLSHSNPLLRSLHLHVNSITLPFLDTLSSRYPSLKLLSLHYIIGGSNIPHADIPSVANSEGWNVDMFQRKYPNWKVEQLVIGYARLPDLCPEFDEEATKIVAQSIPSVHVFASSLYSQHPSWFRYDFV
ncbi:hypothetical protein EYR40_000358 [Pleurotus pulmonarius]|nr:hypothetical protein EYR36_001282 [Pleurotus pulmonarius]KAF4608017.1 hypothetical protein EYR40_000358 [Pleurotus pulmonarius]